MKNEGTPKIETHLLKQALEVAYLASYFQGIELILGAEREWNW